MKFIDIDTYNVEYIVIMKGREDKNKVYNYKYFVNNEEVNENHNLINDIVKFFENTHKTMYVDEIIVDCSVPCGLSFNPDYARVYPDIKWIK